MSTHELRDALAAVSDAVVIPPADHEALRRRAHRLRWRRRWCGVAVGALVAATVAGLGAVLVPTTPSSTVSTASDGGDRGRDLAGLPVVVGGRVELLQDDGRLVPSGLEGRALGRADGRLVVLDGDRLLGAGAGAVGSVARAFVSPAGVSYQLADGRMHWSASPDPDAVIPDPGTLVAAGDQAFVVDAADGLVVHTASEARPLPSGLVARGGSHPSVDVAGGTIAVATRGTERFFDLDGTALATLRGGETGALSPDGTVWAYAFDRRERARGMRGGLVFADTATGVGPHVGLPEPALDLVWVDDELFALTQDGDRRTVWQCDETRGCRPRLISGDLSLALR